MPQFKGFDRKSLKFLTELEANNNREWFAEHKPHYEALVLEPALDFIATMAPRLQKISDHYDAIPKRVGGSLMRVYRDTRFAKDKTPYKTNIGIRFAHELGKDSRAPTFYMNIEPKECFIGVGIWHPDSQTAAMIRTNISEQPVGWRKAISAKSFRDNYELSGSSLKRPPRGFSADDPNIDDLKRKDFIAVTRLPVSQITSPSFVTDVAKRFRQTSAFMRYLCDAVGVPF